MEPNGRQVIKVKTLVCAPVLLRNPLCKASKISGSYDMNNTNQANLCFELVHLEDK